LLGSVISKDVSLRLDTSGLRNVEVIVNHDECRRTGRHIACRWTSEFPFLQGLHIVVPLRISLDSPIPIR